MKKGDKPKDLSQGWWSSNKAKTLKSTELGKALGDYAKVRAGSKSRAYFAACLKELSKVTAAVDKAKKACNATLHAETLEALGGYAAVISAEANQVAKEDSEYGGRLTIFQTSREKLVKQLQKMHGDLQTAVASAGDSYRKLKEAFGKKDDKAAAKLVGEIKTICAGIEKAVELAIETCAPWRTGEAPYNQGELDKDDRDKAGGTKTLEIINPLMVQVGGFGKNGVAILAKVNDESWKK